MNRLIKVIPKETDMKGWKGIVIKTKLQSDK